MPRRQNEPGTRNVSAGSVENLMGMFPSVERSATQTVPNSRTGSTASQTGSPRHGDDDWHRWAAEVLRAEARNVRRGCARVEARGERGPLLPRSA